MIRHKRKKTDKVLMCVIAGLLLITNFAVAEYKPGEFWSRIDDTIVLTNESWNVSIGENETTNYKLFVNGTSCFNDSVKVDANITIGRWSHFNNGQLFFNNKAYMGFTDLYPLTWKFYTTERVYIYAGYYSIHTGDLVFTCNETVFDINNNNDFNLDAEGDIRIKGKNVFFNGLYGGGICGTGNVSFCNGVAGGNVLMYIPGDELYINISVDTDISKNLNVTENVIVDGNLTIDDTSTLFIGSPTTNISYGGTGVIDLRCVGGLIPSFNIWVKGERALRFIGGLALTNSVVVNEDARNWDFRVESTTNPNLFITKAGTNRVGILDATPDYTLDVAGDIHADGNITISSDRIKLLPSKFVVTHNYANARITDSTGDKFYTAYSPYDLTATVEIPRGYKATHVCVYGEDTTNIIIVYENRIDDGTTAINKGNGNVGTEIDITDVSSNLWNYLSIAVNCGASTTDELYGGYVTIIPI